MHDLRRSLRRAFSPPAFHASPGAPRDRGIGPPYGGGTVRVRAIGPDERAASDVSRLRWRGGDGGVVVYAEGWSDVGLDARAGRSRDASPTGTAWSAARVGTRVAWVPLLVGAVLALGLLVRLSAAELLTPHVDEAASVLAAQMVAERGVPILPSGTVYLQGATLSYLLTPLVWLGLGDLADLTAMRLVLVVAGTVTIYLGYRLGLAVTRDPRVGALTACLVALDPVGVQWSGHVRMYGLLQAVTIALAWVFVRTLAGNASRRLLAGLVALFWLGVFTHVGTVLLWPGMALVAAWVHRRAVLRRERGLAVALGSCLLAPVALVGLNRSLGSASVGGASSAPSLFVSFVGDNLLAPLARLGLRPTWADLQAIGRDSTLAWLIPALIVASCSLIAWRRFVTAPGARRDPGRRRAVAALAALYWVPVVAVGVFTVSPKERYLLHVHLLGYVLVAAVAVALGERRPIGLTGWRRGLATLGVVGFAPVVVLGLVAGLVWRLEHPIVHPDHRTALAYVAEHRRPGEPVIAALPAIAYLMLGTAEDLQFLAGPEERPRAQRYTRQTRDGRLIDYWVGVPSIVSPGQLCRTVRAHPDAWLVVDRHRLDADWAYKGAMADTLRGATYRAFEAPGGALVLRPTATAVAGAGGCGAA